MRVYVLIICQFFFLTSVYAKSHHPELFLREIHGAKNEGELIYKHYCMNCHASEPLISLGAPRIGNETDWIPRLNQGRELLFKHTDEGLNAMPARGGCFECSDEQLWLAIIALVPSKAQKELLKELKDH